MGPITRLLFGREARVLAELFMPDDRADSGMADRARQAGEWCASTPGRGASRVRQIRPDRVIRDFRDR